MDEPLSNLDAILRVTMRSELKNLHHRLGVTTIYVTHDQVEAMTLASRIAVMSDGKLLQYDTPQIIFDEPSTKFVAGFIGSPAMNLINGKVVNGKFISDTINTDFSINYEGDITLGIRPDKIDIVDQNSPNNGSVKVFSNESTGESNLITCKMEDQSLIIKADKNTNYEIDNEIFLNFKKEDCYFFDSKSEDRLKL
jgi:multiple sugar transport system ATP-binding protein